MAYKRILTIQDISCFGQCSLTVALPILSACGLETCIIPSAVLSTHTGGFKDFTFKDLTDEIPKIEEHWLKEGIKFDSIYTGYLGSVRQIDYVLDIFKRLVKEYCVKIVDPAFADNGVLYTGFDMNYVDEMKKLAAAADIVVPNISEACYLTGMEYMEEYTPVYIVELFEKLCALGCKTVILTGVGYASDKTGVAVFNGKDADYYEHTKIPKNCHGTGDIYASAFAGAYLRGKPLMEAAKIAADYTYSCIAATVDDKEHWYGVKFETVLPQLISAING